MKTRNLIAGAAMLSLGLPAMAATTQAASSRAETQGAVKPVVVTTQNALPPAKTQGGITYLSGGIGHNEAVAMKHAEKNYPLSMTFAKGKRGQYLSDVDVTIKKKSGATVLKTESSGPIMLVKLPAGDYRISAKADGKMLQRDAKVAARGDTHLSFNWPKA